MKRVTAIFLQGLIAILPLAVTVLLLSWLAAMAERTLGHALKWILPESWYVAGMGVLVGLVLTFTLGLLVNAWGMPQLIRFAEGLIGRIPLVKTIYGAVHDLLGFFGVAGRRGHGNKAVIVSLLDGGVKVVGLLTRERFDKLPLTLGEHVVVYVPYSYQIGGGCTLVVPRERVQALDMSLEEAMHFVVTAGVKASTPSI